MQNENFIILSILQNMNGKIISALNLAFIAYDYKYKMRRHNTIFWPDGFISEITSKKKIPG